MKSGYRQLGEYIEEVTRTNSDLKYGIDDVRGCSNTKKMMQTRANLIGRTYEKFLVLQPGEFVFNRRTTRNGEKIGMAYNDTDREYIFTEDYVAFRVKDECLSDLLPEYLYLFFCRSEFDRYARFKSHGSATELFQWRDMCSVPFTAPDIEEQKKIVHAYKVIEDRINLKKRINENLLSSLENSYKEIFADANTKYEKVSLKDICSKIGSGATPKGGKSAYVNAGISLIRSTNVFDYRFEYDSLAHINQKQADELSNVIVEPNDILFNITGVSVTRCCIVPNDVLPARVNQHVMIIRPNKGRMMSYYLMFCLCSSDNKAKLLGISLSGSTREAINKQEMESYEIPLPNDADLNLFGNIAKCVYDNIQFNIREIHILEEMKSTLLATLSSN